MRATPGKWADPNRRQIGMALRKAAPTLPNAPLVEAVFEFRWALAGPQELPPIVRTDPAYWATRDEFTIKARKMGFGTTREMAGPQEVPGGHTVGRRFYIAEGQEFPLLQIGPGIFASNQSAEYEWQGFKKQTLRGLDALLTSYPSLPSISMTPTYLELRYIDAFDASLLG